MDGGVVDGVGGGGTPRLRSSQVLPELFSAETGARLLESVLSMKEFPSTAADLTFYKTEVWMHRRREGVMGGVGVGQWVTQRVGQHVTHTHTRPRPSRRTFATHLHNTARAHW